MNDQHRSRQGATTTLLPLPPAALLALLLTILVLGACSSPGDDTSGPDTGPTDEQGDPTGSEGGQGTPSRGAVHTEVSTAAGTAVPLVLDSPHLAVIVDEGGRCETPPCHRTLELGVDGNWTFDDAGEATANGTYDAASLAELANDTSEETIVLGPFQGECPTAYDGAERSYLVFLPDSPADVAVSVGSCHEQLDASAPLLEALDFLFVEASR